MKMRSKSVARISGIAVFATAISISNAVHANGTSWKAAQIADALTAAPPAVTKNARIYAWNAAGQMVLIRHGTGTYSCVASGNTSTRVGKPPLPYPDPMCLDQNAWAFFQVLWSEKNPMKPTRPYPTEPGMVWMLAGMGVGQGMVKIGSSGDAEITVAKSGKKIARLSPHLMIMPFPVNESASPLASAYDPAYPDNSWIMFPGTPIEHVMMHFSNEVVQSMMLPRAQ
jgi:hypothetical protein